MNELNAFIGLTSLHGWQYLKNTYHSKWKLFYWASVLLFSNFCAIWVLVKSIGELNDETVITFEDPVQHPLSEIYFPALTLCNVNQVRRSYFEELV